MSPLPGPAGPTLGAAIRAQRDRLRAAGLATPSLDARLLAGHVLGLSATQIVSRDHDPMAQEAIDALARLVARRLAGEPVARIVGAQEFYGLAFALDPATLVPRPETEMLVDHVVEGLGEHEAPRLLDLGTGTGCIPIAILVTLGRGAAVATDIVPDALATARRNAQAHGVAERVDFRAGSWWDPIGAEERFDAITANPPYIETAAIAGLAPEVRDFDPRAALDGGADGLGPYRIIAAQAAARLAPGGRVALEIGSGQGRAVAALLSGAGLVETEVHRDLAGHDRMVTARLKKP